MSFKIYGLGFSRVWDRGLGRAEGVRDWALKGFRGLGSEVKGKGLGVEGSGLTWFRVQGLGFV